MDENELASHLIRYGWGSGFHLPVSTEENHKLENELESKQREVLKLQSILDTESRRVQDLQTHLSRSLEFKKNVEKMATTQRETLGHANKLKSTAQLRVDTSRHDFKILQTQLEEIRKRRTQVTNDFEKRQRRISELSSAIEWDQSAIASLRSTYMEGENDIQIMANLFNIDEGVTKETEAAYKKIRENKWKLEKQLNESLANTKEAQLILDRLTIQYHQFHKSRNESIQMWKGVIESLKVRDARLDAMSKEYTSIVKKLHDINNMINEKQSQLLVSKNNAAELEANVLYMDRMISNSRSWISTNQNSANSFIAETKRIQLEIQNFSNGLRDLRKRKSNYEEELQNSDEKKTELKAQIGLIRDQFQRIKYGPSSNQEKFRELDIILDYEEEQVDVMKKETDKRKQILVGVNNQMKKLKNETEQLENELKGNMIRFKNDRKLIKTQNFKIHQRQSLYYEFELKCLVLERKIRQEFDSLDNHIKQTEMEDHLEQLRMVLDETLKEKLKQKNLKSFTESVLNRIKKEMKEFSGVGNKLKNDNENIYMLIQSYKREKVNVTKLLQDAKIEFMMTFLQKQRLNEAVKGKMEKIYSAEKTNLDLQIVSEGKRVQIQMHINILEHHRRGLLEERAKLLQNLHESQSYVKHWKTKYELTMTAMASNEESGKSEAYYLIKSTQEKELLKREGEIWDKRVKDAEKDVHGLQNTLAIVSNSNSAYKKVITPNWKLITEQERKAKTRQVVKEYLANQRQSERKLDNLTHVINDKKAELKNVTSTISILRDRITDRKHELYLMYQEINSQKAKLDRAIILTRRLLKQLGEFDPRERDLIESEIKLKCLKEKLEFAMKTLQKTIITFPKLLPSILEYFKAHKSFIKLAERFEKQEAVVEHDLMKNLGPHIGIEQ